MSTRVLHLCGGLQSSGSTLVSWCFLQRIGMDGVLDARFDALPDLPSTSSNMPWCKFTIACFRFSEVQSYFEEAGWTVRPLLVVRDVRAVFNSLIRKTYGRNGIAADDPPLRLRLRRFREDWEQFQARGWPVLRFEDMINEPETSLRDVCARMNLPWDAAMLSWPKTADQMADAKFGNPTFIRTRGQTLWQTVKPSLAAVSTTHIPPEDLQWMEAEFAEMNRAMRYDAHVPSTATGAVTRAVPTFEVTRRAERQARKNRFPRLLKSIRSAAGSAFTGGSKGMPPAAASPPPTVSSLEARQNG